MSSKKKKPEYPTVRRKERLVVTLSDDGEAEQFTVEEDGDTVNVIGPCGDDYRFTPAGAIAVAEAMIEIARGMKGGSK